MAEKGRVAIVAQTDPTYSPKVYAPNGISVGSSVSAGSSACLIHTQTDTQASYATPSAAMRRIYAAHAMRPKVRFSGRRRVVLVLQSVNVAAFGERE